MTETIAPLTDDEYAVLLIAKEGESMLAIGRWEIPVKSLVARGYLKDGSGDGFNNYITDAGRIALAGYDEQVSREFYNVLLRASREQPEMLEKPIKLKLGDGE